MYQVYSYINGEKKTAEFTTLSEAQDAVVLLLREASTTFYISIVHEGTTVQEFSG